MPKDLPPGSICYDDWRMLTDGGHLDRINHLLIMADREKAGRDATFRQLSIGCADEPLQASPHAGHHRCAAGQMRRAPGRAGV